MTSIRFHLKQEAYFTAGFNIRSSDPIPLFGKSLLQADLWRITELVARLVQACSRAAHIALLAIEAFQLCLAPVIFSAN